ncbi:hypothetical protein [Vibrio cholerae]|uniref:hypothetical protein n=1 Tax=Vibrio cholerae TaxID=666 RepID=UPI000E6B9B2F|nr:hypothetical protein [Vibrio cholerae]
MRLIKYMLITISLLPMSSLASSSVLDLEKENEELKKECIDGKCSKEKLSKIEENNRSISSVVDRFKFGVAIGYEHYKDSFINEAQIVGSDRIVRISDRQDYKPSIWLETHYIWDGIGEDLGFTHSAPGFYVGARLLGPDSDVFQAFSLGLMWSFKRSALSTPKPEGSIADSINIGVGPVWHRTRVLADGIREGEALPARYDDIQFDEEDEISWMLMVSVGF